MWEARKTRHNTLSKSRDGQRFCLSLVARHGRLRVPNEPRWSRQQHTALSTSRSLCAVNKKAEQKMLFTSGHFVTVCIALNHKCNDWEWGSHCTQEKTTKRGAGACQNSAKRAEPQINVFLHIWEVQKPWVTNCGDRFHYRACKSNPGGASPPAVLQRCPQIRQSLPRGPPWASLLHYICKPPWYYLHCCTNTPLEGEEGALLWQVQLDRQKHCPQPCGTGPARLSSNRVGSLAARTRGALSSWPEEHKGPNPRGFGLAQGLPENPAGSSMPRVSLLQRINESKVQIYCQLCTKLSRTIFFNFSQAATR